MKYKYKIGAIILSICLLVPMFSMMTYAASGSVSVSSKSGTVGSKVTVSCTIRCGSGAIGYADVTLSYDPAALQFVSATNMAQGSSGGVHYVGTTPDGTTNTLSFSITFKILKAGAHRITTTTASASDINEVPFTPSAGSGTITGRAPSTNTNEGGGTNQQPQDNKDGNNKLSSLQVYPGTLAQTFAANITSYTVTVPADTTEVTISATPQSNKASVSVSGGKDLKLGANEAQVVVMAENGSSIAYTITIMCGEVEKIQFDGIEHTINESFSDEEIPTGFNRTKVTYNERQYEGVTNASGNLHLMSLQNEAGADFYIYDEQTQEFYSFAQITFSEERYIILLPLNRDVAEFEACETVVLQIQEKSFDAWKLDDEFSIVCALNQDGENVFYRYDSVDSVFQRYTDVTIEKTDVDAEQKAWFPNEYYMYAIAGLGALVVILFISMICLASSRKQRHDGRKKKVIKKMEKQKRKEEKRLEKQRKKEEKAMREE